MMRYVPLLEAFAIQRTQLDYFDEDTQECNLIFDYFREKRAYKCKMPYNQERLRTLFAIKNQCIRYFLNKYHLLHDGIKCDGFDHRIYQVLQQLIIVLSEYSQFMSSGKYEEDDFITQFHLEDEVYMMIHLYHYVERSTFDSRVYPMMNA